MMLKSTLSFCIVAVFLSHWGVFAMPLGGTLAVSDPTPGAYYTGRKVPAWNVTASPGQDSCGPERSGNGDQNTGCGSLNSKHPLQQSSAPNATASSATGREGDSANGPDGKKPTSSEKPSDTQTGPPHASSLPQGGEGQGTPSTGPTEFPSVNGTGGNSLHIPGGKSGGTPSSPFSGGSPAPFGPGGGSPSDKNVTAAVAPSSKDWGSSGQGAQGGDSYSSPDRGSMSPSQSPNGTLSSANGGTGAGPEGNGQAGEMIPDSKGDAGGHKGDTSPLQPVDSNDSPSQSPNGTISSAVGRPGSPSNGGIAKQTPADGKGGQAPDDKQSEGGPDDAENDLHGSAPVGGVGAGNGSYPATGGPENGSEVISSPNGGDKASPEASSMVNGADDKKGVKPATPGGGAPSSGDSSPLAHPDALVGGGGGEASDASGKKTDSVAPAPSGEDEGNSGKPEDGTISSETAREPGVDTPCNSTSSGQDGQATILPIGNPGIKNGKPGPTGSPDSTLGSNK